MTENEALGYLKNSKRQKSILGILPGSDIGNTIIKALEELKQYRAIGTLEECRSRDGKADREESEINIPGKRRRQLCRSYREMSLLWRHIGRGHRIL